MLTMGREFSLQMVWSGLMLLNAIVEKLTRRSKDDFKGRHFEA